jgi:hypothetical protein
LTEFLRDIVLMELHSILLPSLHFPKEMVEEFESI